MTGDFQKQYLTKITKILLETDSLEILCARTNRDVVEKKALRQHFTSQLRMDMLTS